jgi:hypothetical protein
MLFRTFTPLVLLAGPAWAETLPFEGTWACDADLITLSAETYQGQPVDRIERGAAGEYILTMPDGLSFVVKNISDSRLIWSTDISGDGLECLRVTPDIKPRWEGVIDNGQVEAHVEHPTIPGARMSFTCTGRIYGNLGMFWPGNEPQRTLEVSLDGGPFASYAVGPDGKIRMEDQGYNQLIADLAASSVATWKGRNGDTIDFSLEGSSEYMRYCGNPDAAQASQTSMPESSTDLSVPIDPAAAIPDGD